MNTRRLFLFLPLLFALPADAAECPTLLDHRYTTLQGSALNLCDFVDRPILVVNTARGAANVVTGSGFDF
jgi:glutathione peroxidase